MESTTSNLVSSFDVVVCEASIRKVALCQVVGSNFSGKATMLGSLSVKTLMSGGRDEVNQKSWDGYDGREGW